MISDLNNKSLTNRKVLVPIIALEIQNKALDRLEIEANFLLTGIICT